MNLILIALAAAGAFLLFDASERQEGKAAGSPNEPDSAAAPDDAFALLGGAPEKRKRLHRRKRKPAAG